MASVAVITNMATVVFVTNNNPFVMAFAEEHPVWTFLILEVWAINLPRLPAWFSASPHTRCLTPAA